MSDSKTFSALEKIDNCKESVQLSREECEELVSYIKMLQDARQTTAIRADRAVSMVERLIEAGNDLSAFAFIGIAVSKSEMLKKQRDNWQALVAEAKE